MLKPRLHLLPTPAIHADLAALAALATTHEHSTGRDVQIAFGERERLADAQPGTPQQHDKRPRSEPKRGHAGAAHHRDDLLHRRWVRGVAASLVGRYAT